MEKKPLVLIIISLCFFISPFFILLQAAIAANTPMIGYDNIFIHLSAYDIIILLLYFACAVAIFTVQKWGWYFYISVSLCLIAGNILVFLLRPQYLAFFAIIYNLVLTVTGGIFFRRSIITPYFHPKIRWWEQAARYSLRIEMHIKTASSHIRAEMLDLSSSGAFIETSVTLPSQQNLSISMHAFGYAIDLQADIVRTVNHGKTTGIGLAFCNVDPESQKALNSLLAFLEKAKIPIQERTNMLIQKNNRRIAKRTLLLNRTILLVEGDSQPAMLLDLSRTGCLLQMDCEIIKLNHGIFSVSISCMGINTMVYCKLRWAGKREGQNICGVVFNFNDRNQKKAIRKIVDICAKIPTAKISPTPLPSNTFLELALKTPYKHVHKIKTLFAKTSD